MISAWPGAASLFRRSVSASVLAFAMAELFASAESRPVVSTDTSLLTMASPAKAAGAMRSDKAARNAAAIFINKLESC